MLSSIHPSIHYHHHSMVVVGWLVGWWYYFSPPFVRVRSCVCMHAWCVCCCVTTVRPFACIYTHTLATVLLLLLLYIIIIIISLLLCCVSNNNNNSGGSSNNERWASYELRFVQYHLYLFHTYIHTRWEGVPIELSLYVHSNHPSLTAASAGNIVHVSIDNSSSQKCWVYIYTHTHIYDER